MVAPLYQQQPSLFGPDEAAQLAPPWWACLSAALAAAGVAETEHLRKQAAQARRAQIASAATQRRLELEVPVTVPLPATRNLCHQAPVQDEDGAWTGGICPVLSCHWNVLLDVKCFDDTETIVVGARGGGGEGVSLAAKRNASGAVDMDDLDAVVDAVVARADSIPSSCMWDYLENSDLIESHFVDGATAGHWRPHMSLEQIAEVFGVTRQAISVLVERLLVRLKPTAAKLELDPAFVPTGRLVRR